MSRVSETEPSWCHRCDKNVEPAHWFWQKGDRYRLGGTWRCVETKRNDGARYYQRVNADPVKRAKRIKYEDAKYADENNKLYIRFSAYITVDRKLGRTTVGREEGMEMMKNPCFYCEIQTSGGLDRIDNDLGHSSQNIRPCCMQCNHILGDLPVEAKDLLAPGLKASRKAGALDTWIPPQVRGTLAKQKLRLENGDINA